MKRILLLLALAAAIAAACATAQAQPVHRSAFADPGPTGDTTLCNPTGCGGGGGNCLGDLGYSFVGYWKQDYPQIGGALDANFNMIFSDVVVNDANSHVDVAMSANNGYGNATGGYYIHAGIEQNTPTSGIHFFLEANTAGGGYQRYIYQSPEPNEGQAYAVSIHHDAQGQWTANVPGHSLTVTGLGVQEVSEFGEAENLNSTQSCNIFDAKITGMYPYGTASMNEFWDPTIANGNKYNITNVGATTFEAYGPMG